MGRPVAERGGPGGGGIGLPDAPRSGRFASLAATSPIGAVDGPAASDVGDVAGAGETAVGALGEACTAAAFDPDEGVCGAAGGGALGRSAVGGAEGVLGGAEGAVAAAGAIGA